MEKFEPTCWLKIQSNEEKTRIDAHGTGEELGLMLMRIMKSDDELRAVITAASMTLLLADKMGKTDDNLEEKLSTKPSKYTA